MDITLFSPADYVRLHGQVAVIVSDSLLLEGCGHVAPYVAHRLVSQWARGTGLLGDLPQWMSIYKQALDPCHCSFDSGVQVFPPRMPFGYLGVVTGLPSSAVPWCYFQLSFVGVCALDLGSPIHEFELFLEVFFKTNAFTPCVSQLFHSLSEHQASPAAQRRTFVFYRVFRKVARSAIVSACLLAPQSGKLICRMQRMTWTLVRCTRQAVSPRPLHLVLLIVEAFSVRCLIARF